MGLNVNPQCESTMWILNISSMWILNVNSQYILYLNAQCEFSMYPLFECSMWILNVSSIWMLNVNLLCESQYDPSMDIHNMIPPWISTIWSLHGYLQYWWFCNKRAMLPIITRIVTSYAKNNSTYNFSYYVKWHIRSRKRVLGQNLHCRLNNENDLQSKKGM